jgi:hypothetical protein
MSRFLVAVLAVVLALGCTISTAEVSKAPATTGVLALTVNVRNAEVFVDGALFGQTKRAGKEQNFNLTGGKHELVIKKFGFEDYKATIGVETGGINTLTVELKRVPPAPVALPKEATSEKAPAAKEVEKAPAAKDAKAK